MELGILLTKQFCGAYHVRKQLADPTRRPATHLTIAVGETFVASEAMTRVEPLHINLRLSNQVGRAENFGENL